MSTHSFFRIKLSYREVQEDGFIATVKPEILAMAADYTEAESIAVQFLDDRQSLDASGSYEIIKTKIVDLLYNNTVLVRNEDSVNMVRYFFKEKEQSESGLYEVTFSYVAEKSSKPKMQKGSVYVVANSSTQAIQFATAFIKENYSATAHDEAIVRTVKYDKAREILVTHQQHEYNVNKCPL